MLWVNEMYSTYDITTRHISKSTEYLCAIISRILVSIGDFGKNIIATGVLSACYLKEKCVFDKAFRILCDVKQTCFLFIYFVFPYLYFWISKDMNCLHTNFL